MNRITAVTNESFGYFTIIGGAQEGANYKSELSNNQNE